MSSILKREAESVEDVSKKVKRQIIREARDEAKNAQLDNDFVALYSSTQSEKQWDQQRLVSYRAKRPTRFRSHIGKIEIYKWNSELLVQKLVEMQENIDNWTQLAREVDFKVRRSNEMPRNAGQVRSLTESVLSLYLLYI